LTDSSGQSVPLDLLFWADPSVLVYAPALALSPDTTYTISIAGLTDLSGNPMQGAVTTTFVTGESLDLVAPTGSILMVSPLPTNVPMRIGFNLPISPATVTASAIQLYAGITGPGSVLVPSTYSVSNDDLSITVTPVSPLAPGQSYFLQFRDPTDFSGNVASINNLFNGTFSFVAGSGPDTTVPTTTIYPPDGTTGFPIPVPGLTGSTQLTATFSKPANVFSSPPVMQVSSNGAPVTGTVTTTNTSIAFTPSSALTLNTTYRITVSGVVDYVGNAAATASAAFTTSPTAAAQNAPFSVVSFQPANGAVGVANNGPIVIAFTEVLAGVPTGAGITIQSSSPMPAQGQWSLVNADTLQFTPSNPWPSAATITVNLYTYGYGYGYLTDAAGVHLDKNYTFSFTTAVSSNTTPLTLFSISPPDGTPLQPGDEDFTLTFSKPVALATQAIQALNGNQFETVNTNYGANDSIIQASTYTTAGSTLTLALSSGITDGNGNSLAPVNEQYPILNTTSGPPAVTSVSPNGFATNVADTAPIELQFSQPMDPASLLGALQVTENGASFAGQWQLLNSNQTAQFTPAVPYKGGSTIAVFVLLTAANTSGVTLGQQYESSFTVAGAATSTHPRPLMSVALAGFRGRVDPSAALDLAFDRDLDPATVADNVWLRAGQTRIPGAAVVRGARAIRFQPAEPLMVGQDYVLTAGPDLRSADGLSTEPREFAFRADPSGEAVAVESTEFVADPAPLAVRIRFSGPMNPVSASGLTVLAADGSPVVYSARFSTDGCQWLLSLPKREPVRLRFDGVEDAQGRRLPVQSRNAGNY
jgi:hypothetical protein